MTKQIATLTKIRNAKV